MHQKLAISKFKTHTHNLLHQLQMNHAYFKLKSVKVQSVCLVHLPHSEPHCYMYLSGGLARNCCYIACFKHGHKPSVFLVT